MKSSPVNAPAPPEPEPLAEHELLAWRAFLRAHRTVMDELGSRLERRHDLPLVAYSILITLLTAPEHRLRMTDLAARVLTSPSGVTRAVARLQADGLIERRQEPGDRRSFTATLTPAGLQRLREAQVTHHACIRELLFAELDKADLEALAAVLERAMPGVVTSPFWPPEA